MRSSRACLEGTAILCELVICLCQNGVLRHNQSAGGWCCFNTSASAVFTEAHLNGHIHSWHIKLFKHDLRSNYCVGWPISFDAAADVDSRQDNQPVGVSVCTECLYIQPLQNRCRRAVVAKNHSPHTFFLYCALDSKQAQSVGAAVPDTSTSRQAGLEYAPECL